jgi:hypothetical protein
MSYMIMPLLVTGSWSSHIKVSLYLEVSSTVKVSQHTRYLTTRSNYYNRVTEHRNVPSSFEMLRRVYGSYALRFLSKLPLPSSGKIIISRNIHSHRQLNIKFNIVHTSHAPPIYLLPLMTCVGNRQVVPFSFKTPKTQ